jgi:hypothetical protein
VKSITMEFSASGSAGFMALQSWATPPRVRPDGTVDVDHLRWLVVWRSRSRSGWRGGHLYPAAIPRL